MSQSGSWHLCSWSWWWRAYLFPFHHLDLVKNVGIVHLPQVELELVLVQDGGVRFHKGALVIVETLSKGNEALVTVPF